MCVPERPFITHTSISLAATIVASRVVLGLHYPTDVFAGADIGAALSAIGLSLARSFMSSQCRDVQALIAPRVSPNCCRMRARSAQGQQYARTWASYVMARRLAELYASLGTADASRYTPPSSNTRVRERLWGPSVR